MPIPEFNEIKAPALQFFAGDSGIPHKISEVFPILAKHFGLTEEEQNEMLPSGTQRRWHNRANWACYDLFRAGLLARPKKGLYQITDLGKKIAEQKPKFIDRDFLMQFPQFVKFLQTTGAKESGESGESTQSAEPFDASAKDKTPEELIESAYQILHTALKKELLETIKKMDPFRFEQLVLDVLVAMGYGGSREEAAQATKKSGDEGIDGVIKQDRLGLDVIYVQAKRWEQTVGRKELQSFVGALTGQQAHKGVFITASDFAGTVPAYIKTVPQKIILIDGDKLAELMIQHEIGVSKTNSYHLMELDDDYFEEI